MHRMQGLRSGMRGMERPTIWRNCFRQYLSDDAGDPLELLEPDPFQRTRSRRGWLADVADAQKPVHALRGARVLGSLSRGRGHRAIHQRYRRFSTSQLYWLWLLHHRMPVRHSENEPQDQSCLQVHAVHGSRGRRARTGMHQVLSDRMPALRQQGRHAGSRG